MSEPTSEEVFAAIEARTRRLRAELEAMSPTELREYLHAWALRSVNEVDADDEIPRPPSRETALLGLQRRIEQAEELIVLREFHERDADASSVQA